MPPEKDNLVRKGKKDFPIEDLRHLENACLYSGGVKASGRNLVYLLIRPWKAKAWTSKKLTRTVW